MLLHGIVFGSAGLLYIALGLPLILGKVGPNPVYGFRTSKTMSDPEIWYVANRAAGYDIVIAGVVILATAAITIYARHRLPGQRMIFINLGVLVTATLIAVAHSVWVLRRL